MTQAVREFRFTDTNFNQLRELALEQTGIVLGDNKRQMVYGRLAKRLRALHMSNFDDYWDYLREHSDSELGELINAITTNLTAFFREQHHFEHLATQALPEILQRNAASRRLRVWSAGCSTGEEAYSIAMTLSEQPALSNWDVRILATDIDTSVVNVGAAGVYPAERLELVPEARRRRWFERGTGSNIGRMRVKQALRDRVSFRPLNLLRAWPMRGPFDVIFCRNVVIYFDKDTQKDLFARFADILSPEGLLYIGHAETLFKVSDRFASVGRTVYRKRA